MRKISNRLLAIALAAVLGVSSVPFSASAAETDAEPDVSVETSVEEDTESVSEAEETTTEGISLETTTEFVEPEVTSEELTAETDSETETVSDGKVEFNEENFPDDNFRKCLENQKFNDSEGNFFYIVEDGYIYCDKVTVLSLKNGDIENLKGIEYFSNLESLDCSQNKLTSLDVSKNVKLEYLNCYSNCLTTLDVSKDMYLEYLDCRYNYLTSLDVSDNINLETLKCDVNFLTYVDISNNKKLDSWSLQNQRTKLDSIKFDKSDLTVAKGKSRKLTLITTPEVTALTASYTAVNMNWTSSDEEVAKLNLWTSYVEDYSGKITEIIMYADVNAVSLGTATITCEGYDAEPVTCTVTVTEPVTSITLNKSALTLNTGNTGSLAVKSILPENAYKAVEWSTSDEKVATVDQNGNVKAISAGTATITCTAADGTGVKATCTVTVKQPVSKITLKQTSVSVLKGKTVTIKTKSVLPSNATNKKVKWSSSNDRIATVDKNGKVTAKKNGKVTITCTAADGSGVNATCKITVKQPVTKITLKKTKVTLKKGKTITLKKTIKPSSAATKTVTWKSSNKKVATVDKNGKVKAVGKGTATITCTAKDGSKVKATCKVTVTK